MNSRPDDEAPRIVVGVDGYEVRRPGVHAPGRRTSFHAPAHGSRTSRALAFPRSTSAMPSSRLRE